MTTTKSQELLSALGLCEGMSSLQQRAQSILSKAGVPQDAYQMRDYGLQVQKTELEKTITNALLAAGVKAVGAGSGRIVFHTVSEAKLKNYPEMEADVELFGFDSKEFKAAVDNYIKYANLDMKDSQHKGAFHTLEKIMEPLLQKASEMAQDLIGKKKGKDPVVKAAERLRKFSINLGYQAEMNHRQYNDSEYTWDSKSEALLNILK